MLDLERVSFTAAAKRTPAPGGAAGVGGQALRSTQRRCGAVNVESEEDIDGPQVTPEGGKAHLVSAAAKIRVEGLRHHYRTSDGRQLVALADLTFEVADGELLTIVGPSGCGKSTLVHLIAGLIRPAAGSLQVDRQLVRGPGRDRGVVFQELAILPWRTVRGNIGHGLEIAGVPRVERERIVDTYIEMVGLSGFEERYPHELSGGMKQRVAVARTLAADPKVILMDEPFAAVDAQTRITLQEELLRISLKTRKTIIFVTHSVDEAVFLGDRVMVLTRRPGRLKEVVDVPLSREERSWDRVTGDRRFLDVREGVLKSVRAEVERTAAP